MKYLYILCVIVFLGACKKQQDSSIDSIHVLFFNYSFESILPVDCSNIKKSTPSMKIDTILSEDGSFLEYMVNNHGVLDTTITNLIVLQDIEEELQKLEPDSVDLPIDVRISCTIKYKNGKEAKICIGGGYWVDVVGYNNIRQKSNNKLLYLIKRNIGYYSWMGDKVMEYSEELQDTSFERDKVRSYFGKEY